jgi:hypothetical protein
MTNIKTTLVGVAVILAGAALFYVGRNLEGGIAVTIGIGFLSAKDHNVTGGSKEQ